MARKKKPRKPRMPPLGTLDKWIYGIGLAVTGVGTMGFLILGTWLSEKNAYADPRVVAANCRIAGLLLSAWCFVMFIALLNCVGRDRPFFGRKDISYGPPKYPEIYPLMMKNAPDTWRSPKVAANRRINRKILLWLAVGTLVFALAMFHGGVNRRNVLFEDGSVAVYNGWNQETDHRERNETVEMRILTISQRRNKSRRVTWNVEIQIVYEERLFSFLAGDFRGDWERTLNTMLKLKADFSRRGIPVVIGGTERLEDVIDDRNLGPEEVELLYRLFEVSPTE